MDIRQKAQQRKEQAESYGLAQKVSDICDAYGETYVWSEVTGGGGLAGDGITFSHNGRICENRELRLKAYTDQDSKKNVSIELKRKKFLLPLFGYSYTQVYHEKDREIDIFRDEKLWLQQVEMVHRISIEFSQKRAETEKQMEFEELRDLAERFGISPAR